MTRRLTLLCVPATAALRAGRFPADDALEEGAAVQIARWAGKLGQPDRVLCSPMACARDTVRALGLAATAEDALREVDYGRWRGQSLKDIGAAEPEALAAWLSDPDMHAHGGESLAGVYDRAGLWLSRRAPGHTLAVTHASVIRAVVAHALGAPARSAMQIEIAPQTLTTLSGHGVAWRLTSVAVPAVAQPDAPRY
ncbi:hypothetical protein D9X30_3379 [Cupriavidus sp. U2]|uniref:histidine phosphatase family protein n=1 Tax=Cupriavidus sp. U2 TaxID=2920269 RepID=UPI00129E1F72|nr:histidine phosphatase family protein [Cupriavidus sp. U2]KAI3591554.1 hypothetical protein D9X30_3379 [Cupriavidus sp. U2]